MELWFSEKFGGSKLSIQVSKYLYHGASEYQSIDVIDSPAYGKVLVLNGCVMLSEIDETAYHEMLAHVPLLSHPDPKRVLVIGGGDGGTVREILKHPGVEEVHLCEIDSLVVDISKEYLPEIACGLTDRRVTVHIEDGVKFIARYENAFDVVMIDSTDPVGPGKVLIEESFYRGIFHTLTEGGIVTAQAETPVFHPTWVKTIYENLKRVFPCVDLYLTHIASYPGGLWSIAYASKLSRPVEPDRKRIAVLQNTCAYYNAEVHQAAFALPNFIRSFLAG